MIISPDYFALMQNPHRSKKTSDHESFSGSVVKTSGSVENTKIPTSAGSILYRKEGAIYSGGNGTGLSFYLEYAAESTEENPVIIARGVDENRNEFKQVISVNDINPRNATLVELQAFASHYKLGKKIMGLSSLPMEIRNIGLTDRVDLYRAFEKGIKDFQTVGRHDLEALYKRNYNVYLEAFKGLV